MKGQIVIDICWSFIKLFPILNGIKIKMVILRKNNSIARDVRDDLQQNQRIHSANA